MNVLTRFGWRTTVAIFLSMAGPALAIFVTWKPALDITSIEVTKPPSPDVVQKLRNVADDSVLAEIRAFAIGAPTFGWLDADRLVEAAEEVLDGRFELNGHAQTVSVPFAAGPDVYAESDWHLTLCSFVVPSLLARAYEVSNNVEYLRAAVRYVVAWSEFESSTVVPRGYVFNDHATAARAFVLTEIWRLYRNSPIFEANEASDLIAYVKKLALLLRAPALFEYRTNHGLMQSLALVHLETAFPLLEEAEGAGLERLLTQFEYYVDGEGVTLEHSAEYHLYSLTFLAAAWRHLGLRGQPVPAEWARRYDEARSFYAALRRPDRTLPPIGDTDDAPRYGLADIVALDARSVASEPLRRPDRESIGPNAVTIKPAAGYAIVWGGLEHWPDARYMSQTVLHWGNFPTKAHKHADELGISLWARGIQWIRAVGYWPYDNSRTEATAWRSSNGPHWLGESPAAERSASLVGSATNEQLSFFDVVRTNADGTNLRRQVVELGHRAWATLDSFESQTPREAEIVWRLAPDVSLQPLGANAYLLRTPGSTLAMRLRLPGAGDWTVDADTTGDAPWNSGVVSNREVTASPALRVTATGTKSVVVALFELIETADGNSATESVDLRWVGPDAWKLTAVHGAQTGFDIERIGDRIVVADGDAARSESAVVAPSADALPPDREAIDAFERASRKYGRPFSVMFERRSKVTLAIAVVTAIQILLFLFVRFRLPRWWYPLLVTSSAAWVAWSLFLGWHFLV